MQDAKAKSKLTVAMGLIRRELPTLRQAAGLAGRKPCATRVAARVLMISLPAIVSSLCLLRCELEAAALCRAGCCVRRLRFCACDVMALRFIRVLRCHASPGRCALNKARAAAAAVVSSSAQKPLLSWRSRFFACYEAQRHLQAHMYSAAEATLKTQHWV